MIGENVKLVFLGGTGNHMRVMIDAPRDVNIVRSTVMEKTQRAAGKEAAIPRYYAQQEHPEKYRKKECRKQTLQSNQITQNARKRICGTQTRR